MDFYRLNNSKVKLILDFGFYIPLENSKFYTGYYDFTPILVDQDVKFTPNELPFKIKITNTLPFAITSPISYSEYDPKRFIIRLKEENNFIYIEFSFYSYRCPLCFQLYSSEKKLNDHLDSLYHPHFEFDISPIRTLITQKDPSEINENGRVLRSKTRRLSNIEKKPEKIKKKQKNEKKKNDKIKTVIEQG